MLSHIYQALCSGFIFGITCAIATIIIAPLQFLKIVKQETEEGYLVILKKSYYGHGPKIFFNGALPYALTNFFSSMAFGISEYIYSLMYTDIDVLHKNFYIIVYVVSLRSFMGGTLETLFSAYYELKEIACNKEHIMRNPVCIHNVILAILIRNIIFWYGTVISYILHVKYSLSYTNFTILSFILGMVFGSLSTPFDVVATKICGHPKNTSARKMLIKILKDTNMKNNVAFSGTIMRIIQMGILTMVSVFTMLYLDKYVNF